MSACIGVNSGVSGGGACSGVGVGGSHSGLRPASMQRFD